MNAQQIDRDQLRELSSRATPGPWHWDPPSDEAWPNGDESLRAGEEVVLYGWGYDASGIDGSDEDRAFIAAARTAVPALLDALDQAEAEVKRLSWKCGHLADKYAQDTDELRQEVDQAEARIKAVRDVLDGYGKPTDRIGGLPDAIRRALDGDQ